MKPPALLTSASSQILALSGAFLLSASLLRAEEKLQFNRDVRPILSDLCFQCHGPDNDKRKGGLRLDLREAALKGGKSEEQAVVPGKSLESEIIKRILTDDPEEKMPPSKGGKNVTPEQLATLKRWIEEGAEYQGHWAFSKVVRPGVPEAGAKSGNPVDQFIRERLKKAGLDFSPEVDRATLLRRVSLDLTGLPPKVEEVEAFEKDQSPDAYEKVVDRLLSSPHYGERMAMQWLDFARYADSNGFQADSSRQMSIWRDWVIGAFNGNMPFDHFTIDQLAGDMLPEPREDQLIATGFNRNVRLNGEAGLIQEEWFVETVIDRVETVGSTWLALTVGCARCHDHKFDPFTQKEFFQMFAFFNSVDEKGIMDQDGSNSLGTNSKPFLAFPSPEQTRKLAELDEKLKEAEQALAASKKTDADTQKRREKEALEGISWRALMPTDLRSKEGSLLVADESGAVFSSGPQPAKDTYFVRGETDLNRVTAIRVEMLPDDRLPMKGPGRHGNGNPILSELRLKLTSKSDGMEKEVELSKATADFSQKGWEVQNAIDHKPQTGWALIPQVGKPHSAVFELKEPLNFSGGAEVAVELDQLHGAGALIGKFRVSVTDASSPAPVPSDLVEALKVPAKDRTAAQKKRIADFHKQAGGLEEAATAKIDQAKKARSALAKTIPSVMVMKERSEPVPAYLLLRGQYDRRGDRVERGLPAAFPSLPEGAPMNRLGFAQWLVSTENPLTARVWVNRAWERFFGFGIVKSSENFGSQSEWPSHPELLDWLAAEFMNPQVGVKVGGVPAVAWDMKALQKLIVTSAAYKQTAKVSSQLVDRDPDNRLVARGPRFRLTGEMLRDSALAVSGLLAPKVGGPSVRPYMPEGVWDETSVYGDLLRYKPDKGEDLYRRTLYTIWKRTAAPPTSLIFDSPNREICTVKRSRTNTPLQALSLLNENTFVESARRLAERMILEGGQTPEERLEWAFRTVISRKVDAKELAVLRSGLEKQLAIYSAKPAEAKMLLEVGDSKPRPEVDPAELAAYTVSANVLLNIDEFISR